MFDSDTSNRNFGGAMVGRIWIAVGVICGFPIVTVLGYRFCTTFFTASFDETASSAASFIAALLLWMLCCWIAKLNIDRLQDEDPRFEGPDEHFNEHQAARLREVERMYADRPDLRR